MTYVPTESEINTLLEKGELRIEEDIKWREKRGGSHWEFRVPVINEYQGVRFDLQLIGTRNINIFRYSFALLLDSNRRIRGFCPFVSHTNRHPVREKIEGSHKHKWTDQCQDSYVYVPDDIPEPDDLEKALRQFLQECNISFLGEYHDPPPVQLEMEI